LYVDGELATDLIWNFGDRASALFFADVVYPDVLWIGQGVMPACRVEEWSGQIAGLSVWNRPLTANEVAAVYAATPEPADGASEGVALLRGTWLIDRHPRDVCADDVVRVLGREEVDLTPHLESQHALLHVDGVVHAAA